MLSKIDIKAEKPESHKELSNSEWLSMVIRRLAATGFIIVAVCSIFGIITVSLPIWAIASGVLLTWSIIETMLGHIHRIKNTKIRYFMISWDIINAIAGIVVGTIDFIHQAAWIDNVVQVIGSSIGVLRKLVEPVSHVICGVWELACSFCHCFV